MMKYAEDGWNAVFKAKPINWREIYNPPQGIFKQMEELFPDPGKAVEG